jgi:hypothetical protein
VVDSGIPIVGAMRCYTDNIAENRSKATVDTVGTTARAMSPGSDNCMGMPGRCTNEVGRLEWCASPRDQETDDLGRIPEILPTSAWLD